MTALSDLINGQLRKLGWDGLSVRDLMEKMNGAVSKDSVAKYRNGTHGKPSESTLAAWATLLKPLSVEDLREAAGIPRGGESFNLPPEASRLDERQRRAITELVLSITEGISNAKNITQSGAQTGSPVNGGEESGPGAPITSLQLRNEITRISLDDSIPKRKREAAIGVLVARMTQLSVLEGKDSPQSDDGLSDQMG